MKGEERKLRVLAGDLPEHLPSTAFKRRLVAVMFTDITGFSSLMGRDEERTMRLVQQHRKVVRACLGEHDGTEHETIGDAFVVLFESAVNAVKCACAIHRALAEYNDGRPPEEQVRVRIGIHLGDVLFSADKEIYGDAVNIAARVQPLAEPGGICVTDAVQAQCRGKVDVAFQSIGRKPLKNIAEPPELFRAVPGRGLASAAAEPGAAPRRRVPAVALVVLAALLAAAVVAVLLRGRGGQEPREETSVAAAGRPDAAPAPDGAAEASAAAAAGDAAADGGRTPDPTKTDPVFSADPVAQRRFRTAYDAYLSGHLATAETEFAAGLASDPQSGLGLLFIADIYLLTGRDDAANRSFEAVFARLPADGREVDPRSLAPEGELLAYAVDGLMGRRSAEETDRAFAGFTRAYPNLVLGYVLWGTSLVARSRCDLAVPAFDRSIDRDPSIVIAFIGKARCLLMTERHEEALAVMEGAAKWHPDSGYLAELTGETLYLVGRREEGLEKIAKAVALDPGLWLGKVSLASGSLEVGREEEAGRLFADLAGEDVPSWVRRAAAVAHSMTLAGLGRLAEAVAVADEGRRAALAESEFLGAWRFGYGSVMYRVERRRWDEAAAVIGEMRAIVTDLAFPGFAKNYRLADLSVLEGVVAAERGDVAAARGILDRLEALDDALFPLGPQRNVVFPVKWRVLAREGKWDEALALLRPAEGSEAARLPNCGSRRDEVRVLRLAGRGDEAAAALDALLRFETLCGGYADQGYMIAQALVWRAELAAEQGDAEAARGFLERYRARWPRPDGDLAVVAAARRLAARLGPPR